MCHQTLEKSIKAYFLKTKQQQPPYIHNLERLLKEAELTNLVSKSQNDFIGSMNPYYISSRYPDDIDDLMDLCNDELASQQLKLTKDFILWLEQKMK
jgi:HEPN domain-containing protein